MEGEGPPFRRVFLLPPNLPHLPRTSPKSTRLCMVKICFALFGAGALGGSFCRSGRYRFFTGCGYALAWQARSVIMPYTSAEIPPAGAPSGFDSAAIVTLALAIIWRCRSAQNDTWVVCCVSCNILIHQSNIHPNRNDTRVVPPRSTTNFLPFLSGSGESENVRISLAECGS